MENENMKEIPPMLPGIFTLPPYREKQPMLLGGYCVQCDAYFFPRPRYCPGCLDIPESREIGNRGHIHSFTVVRIKPPLGLPQPYGIGYVDLETKPKGSGLRVFCLLDPAFLDRLQIGGEVTLKVSPMGHDGRGETRLRPFFTPLQSKEEA
ncbi:MAG: OB-fold domain-containing protein [Pseudomonadota bacterium]